MLIRLEHSSSQSEWLLFNTNSAIYQGENKLIFNVMMMIEVHFVLDQHA
jgi:hypothetical protein